MAEINAVSRTAKPGDEVKVTITNQLVFVRNETPIVDPSDPTGRTLTANYEYVPGTLCVSLNGMRQEEGADSDFVEKGNNLFEFNSEVEIDEDDNIIIDYIKTMSL